MSWKREGEELVWTGREPYRHTVGDRAVLYYPGERIAVERAEVLGIRAEPPPRKPEDKED
ncbi:hypothetical protein HRbin12_00989 [bacterium HR12]|nr:hypothetical protein HRbin12_00989 [bacterium HR12]